jgi:hypothetical protein
MEVEIEMESSFKNTKLIHLKNHNRLPVINTSKARTGKFASTQKFDLSKGKLMQNTISKFGTGFK